MDLERLIVIVVNGAILATAIWILVKWIRARRRFTREAAAQDPIAHWRYPANEWQSFCEAEAARIRRRDLPRIMKIFAGVAVFLAVFMWFKYDAAQYYIFDPRIGMLVLLGVIALILVAIVLGRAHWYLRRRDLEYEVFVRSDGIYELFKKYGEVRSEHKTLFGEDYDLAAVALRKEPYPYLALTLRGHKGGEMEKRIPVPRGHEPQAERVVEALQMRLG